ncbi:MAG TPA: DUF2325 domain-containing protein [Candidatus Sulfotelmatobacter sp.]|jgi:hypothetical protein|nr:DUF2325 domain-containing protein [Candidatus Sulfotelmatobacter sp.]
MAKAENHGGKSPSLDLHGRCILYVGGRQQQGAHFRQVVEGMNGRFAYHDGGMEHNLSRLSGMFQKADVVLFPVDNISHAGQRQVKQLCRQLNKPFLALRRCGSGSLLQALEGLAAC